MGRECMWKSTWKTGHGEKIFKIKKKLTDFGVIELSSSEFF